MNDFVDSFAFWLADFYLLSTVLLAAALAGTWFTRQPVKRLAIARSVLVAIALLAGLCALPGWSVVHLLAGSASDAPTMEGPATNSTFSVDAAAPVAPLVASEVRLVEPLSVPGRPQGAVASWAAVSPMTVFGLAHLAGSACVLAWLGLGALAARRLVLNSWPAPIELSRLFARLVPANCRGFDLLLSDRIDVAVAIGVVRPRVLLPSRWVDDRSAEELQTVLAHEVAHVRHGDLKWLAVSRLLLILAWAQPLYWLLRRSLRLNQEMLADAAAAELSDRQQYAEQLVAWARGMSSGPRLSLPAAMGLWEGPSQLRRRVALLLDERLNLLRRCSRTWIVSAVLFLATTAVLLSLMTMEPAKAVPPEHDDKSSIPETRHISRGPAFTVTGVGTSNDVLAMPWDYKPNVLAFDVQDDAGKPIEGVEVIVYRASLRSGERELVKQATTNERGEVEFTEILSPERSAELADKSRFPHSLQEMFYAVLRRPGSATIILPASDFSIASHGIRRGVRMRPAAELSGRVTDRAGKPVAGATVAAGSTAGMFAVEGVNAVQTDADGRYRFTDMVAFDRNGAIKREAERNTWALAANRDMSKMYPAVYDPAEDTAVTDLIVTHPNYAVTTVRGGDVPGETDVVMQPAAAIEGRVVEFATGKPAADVQVKASGQLAAAKSQDMFYRVGDASPSIGSQHAATTRTDAGGRYRLSNLPAGTYEVWAAPQSDNLSVREWACRGVGGLKAEAGVATAAPDLIVGPGATIHGQLIDAATGEPLAVGNDGPTVRAITLFVNRSSRQDTPVQTVPVTPDGTFELRTVPGKSRVFVMVNSQRDGGEPQGDYRSGDGSFVTGPVFDLTHGESVDAEFDVWSQAELIERRSRYQRGMDLLRERKYDDAIAVFSELIEQDPSSYSARFNRWQAYEQTGRITEAIADCERMVELDPDNMVLIKNLANLLATSPNPRDRDGRRAVALAERGVAQARKQDGDYEALYELLETLAAAQAEAGDFNAAKATQREAIKRAPEWKKEDTRERLKLYEVGKPYRREATQTDN